MEMGEWGTLFRCERAFVRETLSQESAYRSGFDRELEKTRK